ncbi:hypothetical protein [Clostridium felsineum]|uniref:hypothetical protein n=1 Tax=Clostridium felsineum TaxID=36839 RepID=UPI00098C6B0C|nr:hypothetical protein [Clostridium felsineum]URZ04097.1 hypothetical protein CLAUR_041850 [Clostridium felsineum]
MKNENLTEKAENKITEEHKKFKEKVLKMEVEQIYNMSGIIIFTEATMYHLHQLMKSDELCELINKEDAILEGAVQHITMNVRKKYGQTGDLPVEEFHSLIWDYYKMDHNKAKKAMELKEKVKANSSANDIILKLAKDKPSSPKAGVLQMSLFDLGGENNA